MHKENKFFIIFLVLAACGLLYLLKPILTPFLTGALLAYLGNPLVKKLMMYPISRVTSSIIVFFVLFLLFILLILLFIPLIQTQIAALADAIPNMIAWLQNTIVPWFQKNLGLNEELINVTTMKKVLTDNLGKAGGTAGWLVQAVFQSGIKLIELVVNLILIPVVTFYLLCDWNKLQRGLRSLIPRRSEPVVMNLVNQCDSVLSAFFRGQFLVMIILGVIYSAGLMLVGLQIGLIVGLISGFLSIVPYLGFIVGIVIASIAAFVQSGTLMAVLWVCVVYSVGHLIDHMFLTPKLVGNRIGIHPVAVIFAILAGGQLFGFLGVLLALPAAAVIMVWLRFLFQRYKRSELYQKA